MQLEATASPCHFPQGRWESPMARRATVSPGLGALTPSHHCHIITTSPAGMERPHTSVPTHPPVWGASSPRRRGSRSGSPQVPAGRPEGMGRPTEHGVTAWETTLLGAGWTVTMHRWMCGYCTELYNPSGGHGWVADTFGDHLCISRRREPGVTSTDPRPHCSVPDPFRGGLLWKPAVRSGDELVIEKRSWTLAQLLSALSGPR